MSAVFVILILLAVACAAYVAVASRLHKQGARGEVKLVGRFATVERDLRPEGAVMVGGEVWPARTRSGRVLTRAESPRVRVVGAMGHWLEVEPEGCGGRENWNSPARLPESGTRTALGKVGKHGSS